MITQEPAARLAGAEDSGAPAGPVALTLVRVGWGCAAIAAFHAAHSLPLLSPLAAVFLYGLLELTRVTTARRAFYAGFAVGLGCYAPHLGFFWTIFGGMAAILWAVVAFWAGVFTGLIWQVRTRYSAGHAACIAPFIWLGLEFFRSELYYLRFSWLTLGLAFPWDTGHWGSTRLGVYGVGFLVATIAAIAWGIRGRRGFVAGTAGIALLFAVNLTPRTSSPTPPRPEARTLEVAGMQMEFPGPVELLVGLDDLLRKHPRADLLLLSEYTFDGPVPERIRAWCRKNQRHLIVGGKELLPDGRFYNTAFVIDPQGAMVFKQAKSVPIQFFNDGLPAPSRTTWNSPWGRIGIPTCYDLSYARIVDDFIRAGAEALIVPTMDIVDWGRYQHELHGRIGPLRAAEYHLPVVRLASSGISQVIESNGRVGDAAPFPGAGAVVSGTLELAGPGRLPLDRWLGPLSVGVVGLLMSWLLVTSRWKGKAQT